jgi:hypothetical protein
LQFPTNALQLLQHLTYLELCDVEVVSPAKSSRALQPLSALTRLVDLRLEGVGGASSKEERERVTADMLSGLHCLTRLDLRGCFIEPGVLAGKTKLQHLDLSSHNVNASSDDEASVAHLMPDLQHMQQLTFLDLSEHDNDCYDIGEEITPQVAATFSALTSSSQLHHLNISRCVLPADVWQHLFPAGRHLPHLTTLNLG